MAQTQFNFRGSRVLIVGATSGIGRGAAEAFVAAGADVVLSGLPQPDTDALVAELQSRTQGNQVWFMAADVSDELQVARLLTESVRVLGGLDICLNNAGIEGRFGPLHQLATADFDRLLTVNLRGLWLCLKYEIPHLRRGAVILNTASTAGVQAIPMVGVYSATKHGILGLTRAAALELAPQGIRVNAVAPGPVETGLLARMIDGQIPLQAIADSVPLRRIAQPAEIAAALLWLASDGAGYVTGETLVIDGGLTQA
ncbi:MAG: SDR family NAD(P)-dependent oxidoreductase [Pseudohongiellaceae bacterium]